MISNQRYIAPKDIYTHLIKAREYYQQLILCAHDSNSEIQLFYSKNEPIFYNLKTLIDQTIVDKIKNDKSDQNNITRRENKGINDNAVKINEIEKSDAPLIHSNILLKGAQRAKKNK